MSKDICPPELQPIDGKCPSNFLYCQRQLTVVIKTYCLKKYWQFGEKEKYLLNIETIILFMIIENYIYLLLNKQMLYISTHIEEIDYYLILRHVDSK